MNPEIKTEGERRGEEVGKGGRSKLLNSSRPLATELRGGEVGIKRMSRLLLSGGGNCSCMDIMCYCKGYVEEIMMLCTHSRGCTHPLCFVLLHDESTARARNKIETCRGSLRLTVKTSRLRRAQLCTYCNVP